MLKEWGFFYCGVTFTNIFAGTSMCSKHCQVQKMLIAYGNMVYKVLSCYSNGKKSSVCVLFLYKFDFLKENNCYFNGYYCTSKDLLKKTK
uniref:Uncharacterized protein n=1 Tax=Anguilla anguilla TaxID=7936 RepID=A0A0E9VXR4_ANGAN